MNDPENRLHPTALDSDAQQVGALYGKAILGAAGEEADEIVAQLNAIVSDCMVRSPGLKSVLSSPRVSQVEKENLIDRIFSGKIHGKLLNFLKVLCRRDRIGSLSEIQISAKKMRDEELGRVRVSVTSAFALTDNQREDIAFRLGQSLGKTVVLEEQVDPSLLGGILIRVGDQVFDGSVLGRMSAIRSAVAGGIQKAIRDKYASLLSS